MTDAILKPCPFCGGEVEADTNRAYRSIEGRIGRAVSIYCLSCPADMDICLADVPDATEDELMNELVEAWNCRAADNELK